MLAIPEALHSSLRLMAEHSGHIERGGLAIREPSDYCNGGDVIGRTAWIGRPEWAQGCGMNPATIAAAVEKAIAGGKRMGKRQRILVEGMLCTLAEMDFEAASPWARVVHYAEAP